MYVEFHFNAKLKDNTPENVFRILQYMIDFDIFEVMIPAHPFFKTKKWHHILASDSGVFDASTESTIHCHHYALGVTKNFLCVKCSFENDEDEVEKFIDWITPYLDKTTGDFLGFYRYESTQNPVLIFMK